MKKKAMIFHTFADFHKCHVSHYIIHILHVCLTHHKSTPNPFVLNNKICLNQSQIFLLSYFDLVSRPLIG